MGLNNIGKKESILLSLSTVYDRVSEEGFEKEQAIKDRCLDHFSNEKNHRLVCRHFKNEESVLEYEQAIQSLDRSLNSPLFNSSLRSQSEMDMGSFDNKLAFHREQLSLSASEFSDFKKNSDQLILSSTRELVFQRARDAAQYKIISYLADQVSLGNQDAIAALDGKSSKDVHLLVSELSQSKTNEMPFGDVASFHTIDDEMRLRAVNNLDFASSYRDDLMLKPIKSKSAYSFIERMPLDFGSDPQGREFREVNERQSDIAQKSADLDADKPASLSRFGEKGFGRFLSRVTSFGKSEEWLQKRDDLAKEGLDARGEALITKIETLSADRVRDFYRTSLDTKALKNIYDSSDDRLRAFERMNLKSVDDIREAMLKGRTEPVASLASTSSEFSHFSVLAASERLNGDLEKERSLSFKRDMDLEKETEQQRSRGRSRQPGYEMER